MKKQRHVRRTVAFRQGTGALFILSLMLFLFGCCQPNPDVTLGLSLVAEGFTHPVSMAVPDDGTGRLFIVDQGGKIYIVDNSGAKLPAPFLDVSAAMVTLSPGYDERGLLGMAFHPDFIANGRFFVFYNIPPQAGDPSNYNTRVRVSEFRVSASDSNAADPASEQVLLEVVKPSANHNGGQIAFGPDNYLYVGIGDGGGANDTGTGHTPGLGNGQDLSTLLGKILRYDVSTPGTAQVPADNPFVNTPSAQAPIYAYGFRNPWRFSFDRGGSHQLFCADVGQNLFEEVDIVTSGGNYGWNIREGNHCFDANNPDTSPAQCPETGAAGEPLISPIIEYGHRSAAGSVSGIAVIGGYVYRGTALPVLAGKYIFGDWSESFVLSDGKILIAEKKLDGTWTFGPAGIAGNLNNKLNRFVLGLGQDVQGELYVLTTQNSGPSGTAGQVWKIVSAE